MTPTTPPGTDAAPGLPTLDDATVARMEEDLFARIHGEPRVEAGVRPAAGGRTAAQRRRSWLVAGGAAAAVVIVAAVIAPGVTGLLRGDSAADSGAIDGAWSTTTESDAVMPAPGAVDDSAEVARDDAAGAAGEAAQGREVIATASATLEVGSGARAAADALAAISAGAEASGGFVESLSVGRAGSVMESDGGYVDEYGDVARYSDPYLPVVSDTWITVRVPAAELTATMEGLDELGEVTASRVSRQDVTTEAVDLRARVASAEASVERLTALLTESGSLADLIAAEDALAERQAELESLRGQLEYLDAQVSLSSLTVSIVTPAERVEADPAGFTDGVLAGWNGLVAALNGLVLALGFLLPWLAVIGVAAVAVWLIRRAVLRRRSPTPPSAER
ncbi:DUF4349 domain-containing protein [Microbacterium sp. zg.Y1090]|uniref:DUF4349 domain-containing protein n=1 Tax=Microbacterium TaxID=33882 RepID=UPI00214C3EB7|nr:MULTISPECIES: DUF4349 domain-containing protein [unclassified Microbacterium]MCR2811605.1 DUF4349 domain-containing protein [Microbacterium sp. zg.Y1084]MCR2818973.1 DUF4349 domain-containing protein [Microbacterium sp. zg.Y1090]WIM27278.1 DUF4349 domain-containing protein [Microbacterium sp. zg-Y1090]